MITERKLKQIAERNKINPYYQEKDYLQNIFLHAIAGETEMIFKGGTCLKICYNLPRFSEDLDFNTEQNPEQIEKTVKKAIQAFENIGIDVEIERSERFEETSSYTAHLRFKGPLYRDNRHSTNTIQIDAGTREGAVMEPDVKQVNSLYPDIPSYFLKVMQLEEILAEKIAAMSERAKGRDLFDTWFLLDRTEINKELLGKKASPEKEVTFPGQKEYERDLSDLLSQVPPYEKVRKTVEQKLERKQIKVQQKD